MDKIKCLMRNIDEEISDAWKYADRAATWREAGHREAANHFAELAKDELRHASVNEQIMGMMAEEHQENHEAHKAIEMLREVSRDRIEKAHEDIHEMLGRIGK